MRTPAHGKLSEYTNHGCRCAACRGAMAEYVKWYRVSNSLKGLCIECTAPTNGRTLRCEKHTQKANAYNRTRNRQRQAA